MMRNEKAVRAADHLRQYCNERGCGECVFWLKSGRFCTLMSVKVPASFPVEDIRESKKEEIHDERDVQGVL